MRSITDKITVPKWISCRTYLFGQEESRTYISNEKHHSYTQLDGITSDFWKLLFDKADDETILDFARKNGIEEQMDDFIVTLAEQELIICGDRECSVDSGSYPIYSGDSDDMEEQNFLNEMKSWLFKHQFMYSIFFELTYRCNLKCVHCYNPKHMSEVELDFELCKKAIDDAYDLGCFQVTFSGGESFLHTHFYDLVEYARSKHMSVEIFTNGQILASNEALYDRIRKLYPYRICVSLYSTDATMHDKVTDVMGSFEKTYSLINKMTASNMNVQIKNFLLNFNCMDCIRVKELAEKIGATSVADISLIPTIEGNKKTMQYVLDEDELFKLFTDPKSPLYIKDNWEPTNYEKMMDASPCLGGFTGLCVTPTAEVVICVSLPYSVGNLKNETLREIWTSAMNKNENSKLYQWHKVTLRDCVECYKEDYCAFCNYCPGMGYLENGHLKHSDVKCAQAKIKMKAYNYLRKNNMAN